MSNLTVALYFPFRLIKFINQIVDFNSTEALIELQPHKGFKPVCHPETRLVFIGWGINEAETISGLKNV